MNPISLNIHGIVDIDIEEAHNLGGGSGFVQDITFKDKDGQRLEVTAFFRDPKAALTGDRWAKGSVEALAAKLDEKDEELASAEFTIETLRADAVQLRTRISKVGAPMTVRDIVPGRRYFFPAYGVLSERGAAWISSVDEDGYDTDGYAWVHGSWDGFGPHGDRHGLNLNRTVYDITE